MWPIRILACLFLLRDSLFGVNEAMERKWETLLLSNLATPPVNQEVLSHVGGCDARFRFPQWPLKRNFYLQIAAAAICNIYWWKANWL